MSLLSDYETIVGSQEIEDLRLLAKALKGKSVLHVNSTAVGGGVAEILNRLVPMFNELGVPTRWDVVKGGDEFYAITKKMHNALHGISTTFSLTELDLFRDVQEQNMKQMSLEEDIVFIHDPQPAGLVEKRNSLKNHWVWRCHIDVSNPLPEIWDFVRRYVEQYDASVFSAPGFSRNLPIPQALICPSIDPISEKNRAMTPDEVREVMERLNIPMDKPLVTQVSRFDRLKDPVGVIQAFKLIKHSVDARLLLVGGTADDDPEGAVVLSEVQEAAQNDPDILVLVLPPTSHTEINAIQRASTLILQKSLKEGFGLTITEALWKGKPVIAGAVGGIPLQIAHRYSGILTHSIEGTAYWMKRLLQDPVSAKKLGENGREHVRQNFLLTRHIRDYMLLFLSLEHSSKDIVAL